MHHLRLIGYELRPPLATSADLTLLFASAATGTVTIGPFAAFRTTAAVTGTPVTFQYIQSTPVVIDRGSLPFAIVGPQGALQMQSPGQPLPASLPAGSTGYRAYRTLPVVQVDVNVVNEIVASSDGSSGQRYARARAGDRRNADGPRR